MLVDLAQHTASDAYGGSINADAATLPASDGPSSRRTTRRPQNAFSAASPHTPRIHSAHAPARPTRCLARCRCRSLCGRQRRAPWPVSQRVGAANYAAAVDRRHTAATRAADRADASRLAGLRIAGWTPATSAARVRADWRGGVWRTASSWPRQ
jgi:hypothetical protein